MKYVNDIITTITVRDKGGDISASATRILMARLAFMSSEVWVGSWSYKKIYQALTKIFLEVWERKHLDLVYPLEEWMIA